MNPTNEKTKIGIQKKLNAENLWREHNFHSASCAVPFAVLNHIGSAVVCTKIDTRNSRAHTQFILVHSFVCFYSGNAHTHTRSTLICVQSSRDGILYGAIWPDVSYERLDNNTIICCFPALADATYRQSSSLSIYRITRWRHLHCNKHTCSRHLTHAHKTHHVS